MQRVLFHINMWIIILKGVNIYRKLGLAAASCLTEKSFGINKLFYYQKKNFYVFYRLSGYISIIIVTGIRVNYDSTLTWDCILSPLLCTFVGAVQGVKWRPKFFPSKFDNLCESSQNPQCDIKQGTDRAITAYWGYVFNF